jgi:hypothetical protein
MNRKRWWIIGITTAGLLAVALLITATFLGHANLATPAAAMQVKTPKPKASATPTTEACPVAYQQVAVKHDLGRVDSDFATKYAVVTANTNNLSDAQKTLLLDESGKDAQVLASWTHAFGLFEDPSKWPTLVAGNCLSPEGQKLHDQFEGALKASGTKVEEGVAPTNGYNSGIVNGTYGVDASQGVSGDRKAIQITLKDGTVIWIMVRCANPVYPGKPNLPTVPTDNPPPVVPPKPVCIYNSTLPPDSPLCLKPKDKKDDVAPIQGKTPVGSDPVQTTAPAPKPVPLDPATPVASNPGTPAPGASPAPVTPTPAPTIPPSQAPAPADPGTPIGVPAG